MVHKQEINQNLGDAGDMTNVICLWTRQPVNLPAVDHAAEMSKYLETWKLRAQQAGIKSMLVIGITEDNGVQWDIKSADFRHLVQLYIELDAMKPVVYSMAYGDAEDNSEEEGDEAEGD